MLNPAVHAALMQRSPLAQQMPRSRELAAQLRAAIASYRRDHPRLTSEEVAAALHSVREQELSNGVAAPAHPTGPNRPAQAALPAQAAQDAPGVRVVLLLFVALASFGSLIWLLNSNKHGNPLVWPALALALAASIAAIIVFTLLRDR